MRPLRAVVWDFDGTLVDTRQKNLNVTRTLFAKLRGHDADTCPALRTLASYERALHRHRHWKDFYRQELDMREDEIERAEASWLQHQMDDQTAAVSYEGIPEVLAALDHLPHGIVSLNARDNILRFLRQLQIRHHFTEVLGFEAVAPARQKPRPDALVLCIERLTDCRPGRVVYIGDHEADMECVHQANAEMARRGQAVEVIGVGALYAPHADDSAWSATPHFRAEEPSQILGILTDLLPPADAARYSDEPT